MLAWRSRNPNTRSSLAYLGSPIGGSDDEAVSVSGVLISTAPTSSAMAPRCARMLSLNAMVGNALLGVTNTDEAETEAELAKRLDGAAEAVGGAAGK